jgi:DNA-binding PadR family transcriptional regulator
VATASQPDRERQVAPLRGALLGLIASRPRSGYDLAKTFDLTLANVWTAQHSQIYPELAGMLREGLVRVRAEGTRGRKEYAITAKGKRELVRWLTESAPPTRISRNESLLRSFFLGFLSVEQAEELLRREREVHEARLERYLDDERSFELLKQRGGPEPMGDGYTGAIPLQAGIRFERMMIEWTEWALEEVRRRANAPAGRGRPRG